jgi:hypothetical protein
MPDVITTTLTSGSVLAVDYSADFGEAVIAGLLLSIVALGILEIVIRMVYQ